MSVKSLKQRALSNPQVIAEYDKLDMEFTLIDQLLSMRGSTGLTQEQVAERMQTSKSSKSSISRLERGNANPSWSTLLKYAQACRFELNLQSRKLSCAR